MKRLRDVSARPELIVGVPGAARVVDPTDKSKVGLSGPFGRERCLYALPLGGVGAQQFAASRLLADTLGALVADPDSFTIGTYGVWISRLLTARSSEDTRRL